MRSAIISSGLGLALLVSPLFASAVTVGDLQAQIQALLAQIAALQNQTSTTKNGYVGICVNLTRALSLEDTDATTGGEVSKLQQFLANNGSTIYPEARITGFFGPATMRAVQRWQKGQNIVSSGDPDSTGFGYVGARTRAAMACVGAYSQASYQTYQQPTQQTYPQTTYSAPTCTFTPNSTGRPDNIGFTNVAPTAESCRAGCLASRNAKWGYAESGTCVYVGENGYGQSVMTISASGPNPVILTVADVTSSTVTGFYQNLPANSQIRFVNASTGQRYDAQSTMVWGGGSSSFSIQIPSDLPAGSYYLRATDYYNPNTTHAQSGTFTAGSNAQTQSVSINTFTATPSTISPGQAVMFTWGSNLSQTDIAYYGGGCSIEGITQNNVALYVTSGFKPASGSVTYVPPATATYTLRCYAGGKDGSPMATRQVTVAVAPQQTNPVTVDFGATQNSVASGQVVTFLWNSNLSSTDISYYGGFCSVSALTSQNQQIHLQTGGGASGSVEYRPALTATYTLICTSGAKDGSPMATKEQTVTVY